MPINAANHADNIGVCRKILSPLSAADVRKYGRLCFRRMQDYLVASVCGGCMKNLSPLFAASGNFWKKKLILKICMCTSRHLYIPQLYTWNGWTSLPTNINRSFAVEKRQNHIIDFKSNIIYIVCHRREWMYIIMAKYTKWRHPTSTKASIWLSYVEKYAKLQLYYSDSDDSCHSSSSSSSGK